MGTQLTSDSKIRPLLGPLGTVTLVVFALDVLAHVSLAVPHFRLNANFLWPFLQVSGPAIAEACGLFLFYKTRRYRLAIGIPLCLLLAWFGVFLLLEGRLVAGAALLALCGVAVYLVYVDQVKKSVTFPAAIVSLPVLGWLAWVRMPWALGIEDVDTLLTTLALLLSWTFVLADVPKED